jgi:hypothetical protein
MRVNEEEERGLVRERGDERGCVPCVDQSENMNQEHTDRVFVYTRWEPFDRASESGAVRHTSDAPEVLVHHCYFFKKIVFHRNLKLRKSVFSFLNLINIKNR